MEKYMEGRGYKVVTYFHWFKSDENGAPAHNIGTYFSHVTEECIVGVKGDYDEIERDFNLQVVKNAIIEKVRVPSQKPTGIYEAIEQLSPNGIYIDIFGRWINRRHKWLLFGNQVTEEAFEEES